jgi:hypothetical protein
VIDHTTHVLLLASLPAATAIVMMQLGSALRVLHQRHGSRRCPACGRFVMRRRCRHCEG